MAQATEPAARSQTPDRVLDHYSPAQSSVRDEQAPSRHDILLAKRARNMRISALTLGIVVISPIFELVSQIAVIGFVLSNPVIPILLVSIAVTVALAVALLAVAARMPKVDVPRWSPNLCASAKWTAISVMIPTTIALTVVAPSIGIAGFVSIGIFATVGIVMTVIGAVLKRLGLSTNLRASS